MSLLQSSRMVSGPAAGQQLAPRASQKVVKRGMSVVGRFKSSKADDERMRELAMLPEQPITTKYPPPSADLADILPNPGTPPFGDSVVVMLRVLVW